MRVSAVLGVFSKRIELFIWETLSLSLGEGGWIERLHGLRRGR